MRAAAAAVAALAVLCSCCTGAHGIVITSTDELKRLVDANEWNQDITLAADIDFSNSTTSFPLGLSDTNNCVSYTGTFDGRWHTIRGINASLIKSDAGIFCSLTNATIKNLVIDDSCIFAGSKAGSLSAVAGGDITVRNVVSRATVRANDLAGGLIANVNWEIKRSGTLVIENCTQDGNITSSKVAGGFIGKLSSGSTSSIRALISYSRSNGAVEGIEGAGGLVGDLQPCELKMEISHCTSKCFISVTSTPNPDRKKDYFGGFFGRVNVCKDAEVAITNSTRNGKINYGFTQPVPFIGGFIGFIFGDGNDSTSVHIQNCVSDGDIQNRGGRSGGFIGNVETEEGVDILFKNCLSKTNITGDKVAGFAFNSDDAVKLERCVNKGSLEGNEVYGITCNASDAKVVVNMGNMTQRSGKPVAHWKNSAGNCEEPYLMNEHCISECVTQDSTGVYYNKKNNNTKVLLSNVFEQRDEVSWTNHLELEYLVNVVIGSPCHRLQTVAEGKTLAEISTPCVDFNSFIVLNRSTWEKITSSTPFYVDTHVALCHSVEVHGAANDTLVVEDGDTLSSRRILQPFFSSEFIVRDANTPAVVYNNSFVVTHNIDLVISRVSRVETVIDPDGNELDDETIRRETESLIEDSGNTVGDITVIRREDGLIYVTVIVPEDQAPSVAEKFGECVNS